MNQENTKKYKDKQKPIAGYMQESFKGRGDGEKKAGKRVVATVDKKSDDGNKSSSKKGKNIITVPVIKKARKILKIKT